MHGFTLPAKWTSVVARSGGRVLVANHLGDESQIVTLEKSADKEAPQIVGRDTGEPGLLCAAVYDLAGLVGAQLAVVDERPQPIRTARAWFVGHSRGPRAVRRVSHVRPQEDTSWWPSCGSVGPRLACAPRVPV